MKFVIFKFPSIPNTLHQPAVTRFQSYKYYRATVIRFEYFHYSRQSNDEWK